MKKSEITKKIQKIESKSQPDLPIQQNNQYNYYHFQIAVSPKELSTLPETIAKEYLAFQNKQFEHAKSIDNRILTLEEKEQEARHKETPHIRKYILRGQWFAFIIMFAGIGTTCFLGYHGKGAAAVFSAIVSIIVAATQFIALKNTNTKADNSKKEENH
jgi:hypothetical protein